MLYMKQDKAKRITHVISPLEVLSADNFRGPSMRMFITAIKPISHRFWQADSC
jgi:hypothetical protein